MWCGGGFKSWENSNAVSKTGILKMKFFGMEFNGRWDDGFVEMASNELVG